jgi:DNA invertase Pin-like site-specific DNA recombinase
MGVSMSPEAKAARRERDKAVVQRWLDGESMNEIARDIGLSHKGVTLILNRFEAEWRAARTEALRAAARPRPGKTRTGRPSVWPDCPPELQGQYRKIRAIIGSAAAKAQLLALQPDQKGM